VSSESDHLALAERNQGVINFLLTDAAKHPDWIVTVAFYKAVHLVEALFARFNSVCHGGSHVRREEIMKSRADSRYKKIYPHYMALKQASCVARYLAVSSGSSRYFRRFEDYLTAEKVQSEMLGHRLRSIEKSAKGMLTKKKAKKKS